MITLDSELEERLRRFAEARGQSAEILLRKAALEFLERTEGAQEGRHPSGKAWPRRNPVGGVITPV